MDILKFDQEFKPLLKGCALEYSSFPNGDFGDLERVELEGFNKLATVEFWSRGWIGVDVYDVVLDQQVMCVLLSPEEMSLAPEVFERLLFQLK
jgi:hypothetical protein